jgi:hypothetical protein
VPDSDERRERLLKILRECRGSEPEDAHLNADEALLAYIGDDEIAEAFERIEKWYA